MTMLCFQRYSIDYLFLLLVLCGCTTLTLQYCYELHLKGIRISETPEYRFELTMHGNQTLSSVTRVLKDIQVPIWHIVLVRQSVDSESGGNGKSGAQAGRKNDLPRGSFGQPIDGPTILYNTSHKVCEFMRYLKRVRMFANIPTFLLKGGNMSLLCPLISGTYVMRNIRVPPDTAILRFAYTPNTIYTLTGTVYSQLSDKTMKKLCHYDINGTIIKKC